MSFRSLSMDTRREVYFLIGRWNNSELEKDKTPASEPPASSTESRGAPSGVQSDDSQAK